MALSPMCLFNLSNGSTTPYTKIHSFTIFYCLKIIEHANIWNEYQLHEGKSERGMCVRALALNGQITNNCI